MWLLALSCPSCSHPPPASAPSSRPPSTRKHSKLNRNSPDGMGTCAEITIFHCPCLPRAPAQTSVDLSGTATTFSLRMVYQTEASFRVESSTRSPQKRILPDYRLSGLLVSSDRRLLPCLTLTHQPPLPPLRLSPPTGCYPHVLHHPQGLPALYDTPAAAGERNKLRCKFQRGSYADGLASHCHDGRGCTKWAESLQQVGLCY